MKVINPIDWPVPLLLQGLHSLRWPAAAESKTWWTDAGGGQMHMYIQESKFKMWTNECLASGLFHNAHMISVRSSRIDCTLRSWRIIPICHCDNIFRFRMWVHLYASVHCSRRHSVPARTISSYQVVPWTMITSQWRRNNWTHAHGLKQSHCLSAPSSNVHCVVVEVHSH